MKAMEDRIKTLEAEVQELKGQQAATTAALTAAIPAAPAPAVATAQAGAQPPAALRGAGPAAAKVLNPDIAVIGDFLAAAGNSAGRPVPSLKMHESEVAFQAILDPYSRADFLFSFGEQGVDLEEGYLTFPALPRHLGVTRRENASRFCEGEYPAQSHATPDWLWGEFLQDPARSSWKVWLKSFAAIPITCFTLYNRNDVSTVEHHRAYRDLTESTNLDIGASYARGHSVFGPDVLNQFYRVDATMRWKPLRRAIFNILLWGAVNSSGAACVCRENPASRPFGYYVSGDYEFARRGFVGARFDRSERIGNWFTVDGSVFRLPVSGANRSARHDHCRALSLQILISVPLIGPA
jgi:hypothetical protein